MGWTPDSFPLEKSYTAEWGKKSTRIIESLQRETSPLQWTILVGTAVTCFALGFSVGRIPPRFRRFATVSDIPKIYFNGERWLRGRVVSVTDGDTVRVLHVPTVFHTAAVATTPPKLSDSTWSVRICTIDTPETAKFGKLGQPFGEEAKNYLQDLVLDRLVQIRLLERDQYGRAVAEIRRRRWGLFSLYQYVDEAMVKAGWAEVYHGSAAVYGRLGKDAYCQLQAKAQAAKRGIWSIDNRESAAEYKARTTTK